MVFYGILIKYLIAKSSFATSFKDRLKMSDTLFKHSIPNVEFQLRAMQVFSTTVIYQV